MKIFKSKEKVIENNDSLPPDYHRNPEFHKGRVLKLYLYLSLNSYYVINQNEHFSNFVTMVILFAGIIIGVESYETVNIYQSAITAADYLIISVFVFEVLLKVCMEGVAPIR